jgi:hypothetical protein
LPELLHAVAVNATADATTTALARDRFTPASKDECAKRRAAHWFRRILA